MWMLLGNETKVEKSWDRLVGMSFILIISLIIPVYSSFLLSLTFFLFVYFPDSIITNELFSTEPVWSIHTEKQLNLTFDLSRSQKKKRGARESQREDTQL